MGMSSENIKTPNKYEPAYQSESKMQDSFGTKILAREYSISGRDLSLGDPNTSFMYNDIDLSRLDLRRQQDLATLIMDKDKLIEENSENHRQVLKNYEVLMDAFTLKDLELSRTTEAYEELMKQVENYKSNIKQHHEELVAKVKNTESIVKDSINYSVGLVKFCTGIYSLWTKSNSALISGDSINIEAEISIYSRELELSYKPLEDCLKNRPKRLIASLEDARSSYSRMSSLVSLANLKTDFDNLADMIKSSRNEYQLSHLPQTDTSTLDPPTQETLLREQSISKKLAEEISSGRRRLADLQREIEELVRQNETARSELAGQALNVSEAGRAIVEETESLCRKQQALAVRRKCLEDERMKLAAAAAKIKSKVEENEVIVKALEMDNSDIRDENYELEESVRKNEARMAELKWQLEKGSSELLAFKARREEVFKGISDYEDQLAEYTKQREESEIALKKEQLKAEELRTKIAELKQSVSFSENELRHSTIKTSELQIEVDFLSQKLDLYASKLAENSQVAKNLESMMDEKNVLDSVKNGVIEVKLGPFLRRDSEITFGKDSANGFNMSRSSSPSGHLGDLIRTLEVKSEGSTITEGFKRELEKYEREACHMGDNIDELKRMNRELVQEVAKKEAKVTKLRIEEKELLQTKIKLETRSQLLDEEGSRLASFKKFNNQYEIEMRDLREPRSGSTALVAPLIERDRQRGSQDTFFDYNFWKMFTANVFALTTLYFLYIYLTK